VEEVGKAIRKIGVVGAGTMGRGIVQLAAGTGFDVVLIDVADDLLDKALEEIRRGLEKEVQAGALEEDIEAVLSRITVGTDLDLLEEADLVIEAVPEKEELKAEVFRALDRICPQRTYFATNTSSLPITRLASATSRPERFAGMHFMNPPSQMRLVEVVKGEETSGETLEAIAQVAREMGKVPIPCNDSPGFVINRVLLPMINEAVFCLHEGVAGAEEIDEILKLGGNLPLGPLELADLIGLDVCLSILEVLERELGEKYDPCPLLREKVSAGELGRKTGRGFHSY
jgi:3-hydroxybutyryl-CoA dehydrogenase